MVCPILILTSSCSKAWSLDTSYGSLLERKEEREGVERKEEREGVEGRRRERERRGGGGGGGGKREMKAKGEEHSANEGREQLILTVGEEERRKEGRGGVGRGGLGCGVREEKVLICISSCAHVASPVCVSIWLIHAR